MSEENIKEARAAYTISAIRLTIPPEWDWLKTLNAEERSAFLQEVIDLIAVSQPSTSWRKLAERIAAWQKRAETQETQALTKLKQQFVEEGGSPEVASLLGKYRGRLSSVDEFIQNKQIEKSLEQ